ncbi:hypothetical protein BV898_07378 [Hypsibius exemplaris]|uniref:Chromo domain-containing protein n=1 Tax=Hypsibius exemplaris TaxID=2072580 RepID=A0A1W0WTM8_HYPEX|nr:hypothetical protein BV898_07378 [Hypsibius exemplaris]
MVQGFSFFPKNPNLFRELVSPMAADGTSLFRRKYFSGPDWVVKKLLVKRRSQFPRTGGGSQDEFLVRWEDPYKEIPEWIPRQFLDPVDIAKWENDGMMVVSSSDEATSSDESPEEEPSGRMNSDIEEDDQPVVVRRGRLSFSTRRRQASRNSSSSSSSSSSEERSTSPYKSSQRNARFRTLTTKRTRSERCEAIGRRRKAPRHQTPSDGESSSSSSKAAQGSDEDAYDDEAPDGVELDENDDSDDSLGGFLVADSGSDDEERRSWTPDKGLLEGFVPPPKEDEILPRSKKRVASPSASESDTVGSEEAAPTSSHSPYPPSEEFSFETKHQPQRSPSHSLSSDSDSASDSRARRKVRAFSPKKKATPNNRPSPATASTSLGTSSHRAKSQRSGTPAKIAKVKLCSSDEEDEL